THLRHSARALNGPRLRRRAKAGPTTPHQKSSRVLRSLVRRGKWRSDWSWRSNRAVGREDSRVDAWPRSDSAAGCLRPARARSTLRRTGDDALHAVRVFRPGRRHTTSVTYYVDEVEG